MQQSTGGRDRRGSAWALPVHPFLFIALFVVYLLAENLEDQPPLVDVLTILGVAALSAAVLLIVLAIALRNIHLAANLTSVVVLWVFLYQYADDVLAPAPENHLRLHHWGLIGIAALVVAILLRRHAERVSQSLNFASALLLAVNLVPVVPHQVATAMAPTYQAPGLGELEDQLDTPVDARDIYYIILDRYPNQTTLMSTAYGYDNSPFLDALEGHGFYIAEDSRANYIMTALSIASSLNMQYLDADAMEDVAPNPRDWKPVYDMLAGSLAVPRLLEKQGYTYVQLPSWFAATAAGTEVDVRHQHQWLSEFGDVLVATTVVPRILNLLDVGSGSAHIDNALFQFDHLTRLDEIERPKFVFAHILLPHPPYVFDESGPLPSDHRRSTECCGTNARFLAQLRYTNRRVLEVVDALLAGPDERDPIIVIQGDEGPRPPVGIPNWREASQEHVQQKFGILNAYYLPSADDPGLYPAITPVNSFRVLLNEYFGAELPLLEDRVFAFSTAPSLYRYFDITDRFGSITSDVDGHAVTYEASAVPTDWVVGQAQTYEVTMTNTGDTAWQPEGDDAAALHVSFVPASDDGELGWGSAQRVEFDRPVQPGESLTLEVTSQAPDRPGSYLLRHRLAHGIHWFTPGQQSSVAVETRPAVWEEALGATYELTAPTEWAAGEIREYDVTVTNTGSHTWNAKGETRVRLGTDFGTGSDEAQTGSSTDLRFDLPADVPPSESVTIRVEVTAPPEAGSFVLRHRLVKEQIAWFDETDEQPVVVTADTADPGAPVPILPLAISAVAVAAIAGGYLVWKRRSHRSGPPGSDSAG